MLTTSHFCPPPPPPPITPYTTRTYNFLFALAKKSAIAINNFRQFRLEIILNNGGVYENTIL
ncbi:MAG: hypothetical protein LBC87_05240 [Fibromonadaceae bacterium]|nr:hypothetical protein [Fibromonadaceae bacterium]